MNLPVENYEFPHNWKISPVSEVADFSRGVSWGKAEEAPKGKGILVISIPNIKNGWIDYKSKFNHYLSKNVSESKYLNLDDIIFVGSSGSIHNVGRNARVATLPNGKVAFASFTFKATPKLEVINKKFLYFLVNSDMVPFPVFCKRAADGKFNFQLRDFATRLRIPLPPLPEQKKIAHILSTVQRAIEAQEQIIQTTTELFKTMLHQLMTAQIRVSKENQITKNSKENLDMNIEDFQFPSDWKLGSIAEAFDFTGKPRGLDLSKNGEEIPFFPMNKIPLSRIHVSDFIPKALANLGSGTYVENGDLMVAKITPSFENGKQAIVDIGTDFAYATTEVIPMRGRKGESDTLFLFFYLLHPEVRSDLAGKMEGSTGRQRLSKAVLGNRLIPLPPLPEQKKIAQIFSTIQQKVDNAQIKKTKLQNLFRTLLHELMTAKIRVHNLATQ